MISEARKVFDQYFAEHYEELLLISRRLHRDPNDLLHHTYLSCLQALKKNANLVDNLPGYVHTAMFRLSTGTFRKVYEITDAPEYTHISNYDLNEAIRKEEALIMANHLSWFDRTVLELYLDGWSMAELARESGINRSVLYESISQSKKKLRNVIRQRSPKG
jgi:DNA-directed RNA polymerase specialized sigma24 family protein